jgi:hypothetical protein
VKRFIPLLLIASMAHGAELTRAARWELHNAFWMNLHQTLMHDAETKTPRARTMLTDAEAAAWNGAITTYRTIGGQGSLTFAQPMMELQNALTAVANDAETIEISGPLPDALRKAAPVYRSRWWPSDREANRFFIGYASAMLLDAGEEIVAAHETVYRAKFPTSIRVDVTPFAGTFGAYSHSLPRGFTVTIASRDPGYGGLGALEGILHESSHSVVHPREGTVAAAIAATSKKLNARPPRDLWHGILFATTSELVQRALRKRGATGHAPFSADLLTRAWPHLRVPIEQHWMPYLDGKGTLEEAVAKTFEAALQ